MFEEKLTHLKRELIMCASLVEGMIDKSIQGLLKKEKLFLTAVIEQDEKNANDYDLELDELCTNLIAQFEPKAKDLRTVLMIYQINRDLERMGDHAVNIAESGLLLISKPPLKPLIDIPHMANLAQRMIKNSLDAFVNQDAQLAKKVCEDDDAVDRINDQIFRDLLTTMIADPKNVARAVDLILVSRNIERVADHATNISEDVIFIVEGKNIKHHIQEEQTR